MYHRTLCSIALALAAHAAAAAPLAASTIAVTADPTVKVTVMPRVGNTSKLILITVNKQDRVVVNGKQEYPVLPPPPPPPPAPVWNKIADENGTFTLPAAATIRYGSGTTWLTLPMGAMTMQCSNAAFGKDPLPGTVKECDIQGPLPPAPPPPPIPPAGQVVVWQVVSGDNGTFRVVDPNTIVRWGIGAEWIEATLQPGTYGCNGSTFPRDPHFGIPKECDLKVVDPKYTWTKIADEGETVTIKEAQVVRYGKFQGWSEVLWPAGTVFCRTGPFDDPLTWGDRKQCELRSGPAVVIPPPAAAMTNHSGMGPFVDPNQPFQKVDPSTYSTADHLTTLWIDPATKLPIDSLQAQPSDLGAFRLGQAYAGTEASDPMVLPGQPGKSHTHTFFGLLPGAFFTDVDMEACTGSYNAGGRLLCTITWIPSIVDTRTGRVISIDSNLLYYKRDYLIFDHPSTDIVAIPQNLKFVAGIATNTDPDATWGSFICLGPNGENPGWKRSFKAAFADGTCVPGGEFIFSINAKNCWDGRLDSPNHRDHLVGPVQDGLGDPALDRGFHCPADHPLQIPSIGGNYHHAIRPGDDVSAWQFSCDMGGPDSGGACAHMDYWAGPKKAHRTDLWTEDRNVYEMWTQHCLVEKRDCRANLLGDNLHMLY